MVVLDAAATVLAVAQVRRGRTERDLSMQDKRLIMGSWTAIGVGIGAALGVAMNNIGVGLAIGIAIGIAIGAAQSRK
jgi:hypothetical protein